MPSDERCSKHSCRHGQWCLPCVGHGQQGQQGHQLRARPNQVPAAMHRSQAMLSCLYPTRRNNTGFLGLNYYLPCNCDGCNFNGTMARMRELWAATQQGFCPGPWLYSVSAQNIVSAARIRRMPRSFYQQLLRYLLAPPEHFIHKDVQHLRGSSLAFFRWSDNEASNNNNLFGHVLERAWSLIFNCHDDREISPCSCSETSDCSKDSCQCVDVVDGALAGQDQEQQHEPAWQQRMQQKRRVSWQS
jgi:hypothetical protein